MNNNNMNNINNIKQLIIGIITGSIITLSISALANFEAIPNQFPIKLNGNDVSLEGYNINGSTYFKLRDIGDKVGFGVDFADNTINITMVNSGVGNNTVAKATPAPVVNPTPIPWSEVPPQAKELNPNLSYPQSILKDFESTGFTSDGLPIRIVDGKKGVSVIDIEDAYNFKKNKLGFGIGDLYDETSGLTVILSGIKYPDEDDSGVVEYEYYETVLRPFIQTRVISH